MLVFRKSNVIVAMGLRTVTRVPQGNPGMLNGMLKMIRYVQ